MSAAQTLEIKNDEKMNDVDSIEDEAGDMVINHQQVVCGCELKDLLLRVPTVDTEGMNQFIQLLSCRASSLKSWF